MIKLKGNLTSLIFGDYFYIEVERCHSRAGLPVTPNCFPTSTAELIL